MRDQSCFRSGEIFQSQVASDTGFLTKANFLPIRDIIQSRAVSVGDCKLDKGAISVVFIPWSQDKFNNVPLEPSSAGTDFRRQIMTSKVNPRTERIKIFLMIIKL